MSNIDYNQQMLDYYPEVIKAIREFQALMLTESLQVEEMHEKLAQLLANAYVTDCDESALAKWEKSLDIVPSADDTESDRRERILARLYETPKLNTNSINEIVKIFTGADAATTSYLQGGAIVVKISPPKGNKEYKFENVEKELRKKIPAHLNLLVSRDYNTWSEVANTYSTWEEVANNFEMWGYVVFNF